MILSRAGRAGTDLRFKPIITLVVHMQLIWSLSISVLAADNNNNNNNLDDDKITNADEYPTMNTDQSDEEDTLILLGALLTLFLVLSFIGSLVGYMRVQENRLFRKYKHRGVRVEADVVELTEKKSSSAASNSSPCCPCPTAGQPKGRSRPVDVVVEYDYLQHEYNVIRVRKTMEAKLKDFSPRRPSSINVSADNVATPATSGLGASLKSGLRRTAPLGQGTQKQTGSCTDLAAMMMMEEEKKPNTSSGSGLRLGGSSVGNLAAMQNTKDEPLLVPMNQTQMEMNFHSTPSDDSDDFGWFTSCYDDDFFSDDETASVSTAASANSLNKPGLSGPPGGEYPSPSLSSPESLIGQVLEIHVLPNQPLSGQPMKQCKRRRRKRAFFSSVMTGFLVWLVAIAALLYAVHIAQVQLDEDSSARYYSMIAIAVVGTASLLEVPLIHVALNQIIKGFLRQEYLVGSSQVVPTTRLSDVQSSTSLGYIQMSDIA